MNPQSIVTLAVAILANSLANVLIKRSSGVHGSGLQLYLNRWFVGGCALFGINLLFYTYALKSLPLSCAYPLMVGGTLMLVTLFACLEFGEPMSLLRVSGMGFILLGATLVVR
jgi:multidrug transporter EmrE-like cation transporter